MSADQDPKPTKKFGSMKEQWETIGGGKESSTMPQDTLTQKRQDIITSKRQDASEEMKRQTVYMPKQLATRLKIQAAVTGDDISGIITKLVEAYLEGDPRLAALEAEVKRLQERLDIETRYRQDTEVRHFKSWLRSHSQPQDSDFFERFLKDTRLPQHASRSLYEAKLRATGYIDEEITLFQLAWKDMLFIQS